MYEIIYADPAWNYTATSNKIPSRSKEGQSYNAMRMIDIYEYELPEINKDCVLSSLSICVELVASTLLSIFSNSCICSPKKVSQSVPLSFCNFSFNNFISSMLNILIFRIQTVC